MSAIPPKADMCDAARDVRFGPMNALWTKTHSRSRKCPIRGILYAGEYKRANDCDGDCCNACKNEDSHDPTFISFATSDAYVRFGPIADKRGRALIVR